jgi:hypothetical protein
MVQEGGQQQHEQTNLPAPSMEMDGAGASEGVMDDDAEMDRQFR